MRLQSSVTLTYGVGAFFIALSGTYTPPVAAQEISPEVKLERSVQNLKKSIQSHEESQTLETRVRELTWRILAGEIAADSNLSLSSNAFDLTQRGLAQLDNLLDELDSSVELRRELASQPTLAMRFDAAVVRREQAMAAQELSREAELKRLAQLREMNRCYRALIQQLITTQTESILGRGEKALASGELAEQQLARLAEIVSSSKDLYLFSDEPDLSAIQQEVNLIRDLAKPYSEDVQSHQHALLAASLYRVAVQSSPASEELLLKGLRHAEAASLQSNESDGLAHSVKGFIHEQLGILLTSATPMSEAAHRAAQPHFDQARQSYAAAIVSLNEAERESDLYKEVTLHLEHLKDPQSFLLAANEELNHGRTKNAIEILASGLLLHRSVAIVMRQIEVTSRTQSSTFDELAELFNAALSAKIVTVSDVDLISLRGRCYLLKCWQSYGQRPNFNDEKFGEMLTSSLQDLRQSSEGLRGFEQLRDHAFLALAETLQILTAPNLEHANAFAMFKKLPEIAAELEAHLNRTSSDENQRQVLEAIYLCRLSEGYMSLAFLPDEPERGRIAFLEAMNSIARVPRTQLPVQPVGDAFYRAVLQQDSTSIKRQLSEERQLRIELQRLIPALAASKFTSPRDIVDSLQSKRQTHADSPASSAAAKQLDPKDYLGARNAVESDLLAVRTITLVQAGDAQTALVEFIEKKWPEFTSPSIEKLPWKKLLANVELVDDPFELYAVGMAAEYTAISLTGTDTARADQLLSLAKTAFNRSNQQYRTQTAWRSRYPYLLGSIEQAIVRISNADETLKKAAELSREMRISDARHLLEDALLRQPSSQPLKVALIRLQIDESQAVPDQRDRLLSLALQGLIEIDQDGSDESVDLKFLLADVGERLGRFDLAATTYRKILDLKITDSQKVKARSRLALAELKRSSSQ